jgi:hypothetical protein
MSQASRSGRGLAGAILLVVLVLAGWWVASHRSVQRLTPRNRSASQNSLKQLVLSLLNYHDQNQHRLPISPLPQGQWAISLALVPDLPDDRGRAARA